MGCRSSIAHILSNSLSLLCRPLGVSGDLQFTRLSRDGAFTLPRSFVGAQNRNWGEASLNLLSFEVDIWGRLRRATEAARANLLSTEENRKAVLTTLVSALSPFATFCRTRNPMRMPV